MKKQTIDDYCGAPKGTFVRFVSESQIADRNASKSYKERLRAIREFVVKRYPK